MGKSKSARKREERKIAAANPLRGVIARARGHGYDTDSRKRAYFYRQGMQSALLRLRTHDSRGLMRQLISAQGLTQVEQNRIAREPIGYDYLSLLIEAPPLGLEQELRWILQRVRHFKPIIERYLEIKARIQECFERGQYANALELTRELEECIGSSLWTVELTIALHQECAGTEAQKSIVQQLRKTQKRGILPYFANYVSQRCEPTVSISWFRENIRKRLTGKSKTDITLYLEHKLAREWPSSPEDISTCLRVEQNHHEVDIYEAYVSALLHIAADERLSDFKKVSCELLASLAIDFTDRRLDKFRGSQISSDQQNDDVRGIDLLLEGRVAAAVRTSRRALRYHPASIEDTLVLAAARTRGTAHLDNEVRRQAPSMMAANRLAAVLLRSGAEHPSYDLLKKWASVYGGLSYPRAILQLVRLHDRPNFDGLLSALTHVAVLSEHTETFLLAVQEPNEIALLNALPSHVKASADFFAILRGASGESSKLTPSASQFALAWRALSESRFQQAEALLNDLITAEDRWTRVASAVLALRLFARTGELIRAAEIVSEECCHYGTSPDSLPITEVFKGTRWSDIREGADKLSLSIALFLYVQATSDDKVGSYRRFAIESFLRSMGVEKPSDLRGQVERIAKAELVYFLSEVCAPQSLDMLPAIRNSQEVLEERRAVCALLMNLDHSKAQRYEQEILSISRDLAVRDGLRVVDGSRVHVDRESIKSISRRAIAESYNRYLSLLRSGVGIAEDFDAVLRDIAKKDASPKYLLTIPENEADELLVWMVQLVREKFLFQVPHGLDSYLSKRVRHGSIVGHIRGPAESEKVVLQRGAGGVYVQSSPFLEGLDPAETKAVGNALVDFSKAFDNHLLRLKDVILHVKSPEFPLGIFDVTYSSQGFHLLRSALKTDLTLDGFLDSILAALWAFLQPSLEAARRHLLNETHVFATDQLQLLRGRVLAAMRDGTQRVRFDNAVGRALAGVQSKIESAANWFQPSVVDQRQEYTIEEAVAIGVASVQAVRTDFDPAVMVENRSEQVIRAADLPLFVDILYIALGNVAEHSGVERLKPKVLVAITPDVEQEILGIRIESDVALKVALEDVEASLEVRRQAIASGVSIAKIREEGGSGLFKLASITSQSRKGRLAFGLNGPSRFFVEVDLSFIPDLDA